MSIKCFETVSQIKFENSENDHVEVLVTIGTAGYAISTLSLICAMTIMIKFRRLHCPRNTIHINLFGAILFRCIVHFVQTIYTTGQVSLRSYFANSTARADH
ncbi:hypothetical protein EG68_01735 [Paragonimus skrjabini miyazakii]|uniref:Uncharacterized protein n=1 Tax=Paragonimus skrjabini miyazakii TaxID=59628 RepID=A0A8S9ZAD7_9TREM|nr:hypothetical protein EG68_01735 [Paragonimus skrjabini miyazakii]